MASPTLLRIVVVVVVGLAAGFLFVSPARTPTMSPRAGGEISAPAPFVVAQFNPCPNGKCRG